MRVKNKGIFRHTMKSHSKTQHELRMFLDNFFNMPTFNQKHSNSSEVMLVTNTWYCKGELKHRLHTIQSLSTFSDSVLGPHLKYTEKLEYYKRRRQITHGSGWLAEGWESSTGVRNERKTANKSTGHDKYCNRRAGSRMREKHRGGCCTLCRGVSVVRRSLRARC